jgi:hypothetical protein
MTMAPPAKKSHHPHPHPLPTRGRGAHRVRGPIVRHYKRTRSILVCNRVASTGGGFFDRSFDARLSSLDAAVAQRQSNRFVSDRLTVRIRPAAPTIPPSRKTYAAVTKALPSRTERRRYCGFHSRARVCASVIWSADISPATVSRFLTAAVRLRVSVAGKRAAARLNHICAATTSCVTPSPRA